MIPQLPSFGFSSTRQYRGESGDVQGGAKSFTAFSSGVLSTEAAAIIAVAAVVVAALYFKRRR